MSAGHQTIMYGIQLGFVCVACIISGPIGARYGRRVGLGLCCITSIIGPAVQAGVTTYAGLVVGRAIAGLGIGFAANFVIIYWSEAAPVELRGLIVVMYQGLINLAQFVGAAINEGTHTMDIRWAYRGPLLTELAAPLILFAFLFWIPDTPSKYILAFSSYLAQCVRMVHFSGRNRQGNMSQCPNFLYDAHLKTRTQLVHANFNDLDGLEFRSSQRLYSLSFSCFLLITLYRYGTYFFSITGINNPFVVTVITSVCGMAGSAAAFPLIKYFGRRPILIIGAASSAICMLTFAIVGAVAPNSQAADKCLVAFTSIFIFTYGATWGPVPQVVLGEIPSNRLRSKTIAIATTINWACTLLIICGIPYLLSDSFANLGAKVGFIFGGITVFSFFWALFFLPETKGRTLEEIDEMFLNVRSRSLTYASSADIIQNIPPRQFKSYVTTGQAGDLSVDSALAKMEGKGGDVQMIEAV
ncbi:putative glucose transporter rco-3 [Hyphodiscus hymeniophilus]|uniref:Glucose transporter rco-3 n=1 Tax=Hyphodiscus hymeniophilus TaxID=353542 RepID=A0A9P6VEC0_9HELO|nr:putative glucose transporter rco-3 [Hyphodiscus hymeniophilus]